MKYLENGNPDARQRIILAHGAGAAMDSPFMAFMADNLGGDDVHVVRFEFPYMQQRQAEGTKRPPDRAPRLMECWRQVTNDFSPAGGLIIGGKSMGGRIASMVADDAAVKGLVCLGYPFYAPGKLDKPRIEHLKTLKTPTLIVQGVRDAMGAQEVVSAYELSPTIEFSWMPDGDHSFKPRKKSGWTEDQNWSHACKGIQAFMDRVYQPSR